MTGLRLGKNVAIHCGEGFGRTGTVIAGIRVLAELENNILNNYINLLKHTTEKKHEIELGTYSRTGSAVASETVRNAIVFSRSKIARQSGRNTNGQSVEIEEQVGALNDIEEQRIKRYSYFVNLVKAKESQKYFENRGNDISYKKRIRRRRRKKNLD